MYGWGSREVSGSGFAAGVAGYGSGVVGWMGREGGGRGRKRDEFGIKIAHRVAGAAALSFLFQEIVVFTARDVWLSLFNGVVADVVDVVGLCQG